MKRLILLLFSSLTVITSVAQPTLDECHRKALLLKEQASTQRS